MVNLYRHELLTTTCRAALLSGKRHRYVFQRNEVN